MNLNLKTDFNTNTKFKVRGAKKKKKRNSTKKKRAWEPNNSKQDENKDYQWVINVPLVVNQAPSFLQDDLCRRLQDLSEKELVLLNQCKTI